MRRLILPALCAALATQAHALTDTNTNGLSDDWEKAFNGGQLFSAANPNHAPTADTDADGWTNLQEATAGTDPFHSMPPSGIVMPSIAITPATYEPLPVGSVPPPSTEPTDPLAPAPPVPPSPLRILLDPTEIRLTWQPIPGKTYRALLSPDLLAWSPASGTYVGGNDPITYETVPLHEDGTIPEKLFWRVETGDTDTDGDTISDYEEILRNLKPLSADTDGDGLPDNTDPAPLVNSLQAIWDADSVDPSAAPLFAAFSFTPPAAGGYPFTAERVTDISGNNRHGKARTQFQTTPPVQRAPQANAEGIANHGFRFANAHHFAFDLINPGINFAPVASLSFWLKTKAADLEGNGQPVFSYVPKLGVFAQNPNSANPYAARAFLRKQPVGTGYEVVWLDWVFPGNIVRERWTLDLAAPQLEERWINLTFVWQGGSGASQSSYWACYANGVKQIRTLGSTYRFQTTPTTPNTPQDTFVIGADAAGGSGQNNLATVQSTFKGTMDRVRIHTAALTPVQILAIVQQDTDIDGLWDTTEAAATAWKDTNGNGRCDIGEIFYPNGSPLIWQHSGTDSDSDGITDILEQNATRTDPYNHDTDNDLLPDGWEAQYNLNPNSSTGIDGQTGDPDNDGVDNFREWQHLTNPRLSDSDGDTINDATEIAQGSNPNSGDDNGQAPPPEETLTLKIIVGDPSSSHSERWRIEATEVESGQLVLRHASRQYGQVTTAAESTFNKFKPGKAYSFQLIHAGTDPAKLASDPERLAFPDYDWTLQISYKNADGSFTDVTAPAQTKFLLLDPYNADTKSLSEDSPNLLAPEDPWGSIGDGQDARPAYYEKIEPMRVLMLSFAATPDFDRDGFINAADKGKATPEKPHIMWINDNDNMNEETRLADVPGSGIDNADQRVNGARDLIDFFPIALDLKAILAALPNNTYEYFISHPTGAFNFIEMPSIQPDSQPQGSGAGSYLINPNIITEVFNRPLKSSTGTGSKLGHPYLTAAANGAGALLIEVKSATDIPPSLVIKKRKTGQLIANIPWALPVETAAVESLYWRLNIRFAALGQTSPDPAPPTNAKFRDSRKDRWFVFCHGYNVNDHDARGWNAELFKRLHQKGSNARFVGVSWQGNQGQLGADLPFDKVFTPDYWRNAYNAFASSQVLAAKINSLTANTQSKAVIAGHSMGNIIASSALCDHGLKAEQYFLLNAAVAREAYSTTHVASDRSSVRHPDWSSYPTRLWSSDWFSLFPAADGRNKLTWQGRFGNLGTVTTPHNYYSSTEDVLANGTGSVPGLIDLVMEDTGAWIKQEMSKGLATKTFVTGTGANNWTSNGGWGFNPNHYLNYRPDPLNPPGKLPDTSAITDPQLRANPFFKPFTKLKLQGGGAVPDAANGIDLVGANGSTHATEYSILAWLLCHDVPAITNPTGTNPVIGWTADIDDSNTDIDSIKFQWGACKHSDLKNAPIDAVGKLYEKMVERGNLK